MRVLCLVWLIISGREGYAVSPACEEDRVSAACYDAIKVPLARISRTAMEIPLKLTLISVKGPANTFKGMLQLFRGGGRSSGSIFIEGLSTLFNGMRDIIDSHDPTAATSELVRFAAQAVRLIITNDDLTDNLLLRQEISSISPALLQINRQAVKVVNRVGGPRRYFYLLVLYCNEIGLNFLAACKTTEYPRKDCDFVSGAISEALDVLHKVPLTLKAFAPQMTEFMADEE